MLADAYKHGFLHSILKMARILSARYKMNKEEFEKKLTEVAEWRIATDPTTDHGLVRPSKQYKRRVKVVEEDQDSEEQPLDPITQNFPVRIDSVKNSTTCDDCGDYCKNGRGIDIKAHEWHGNSCWRKRCTACGLWQNPFTGQYTMDGNDSIQLTNKWLRNKHNPDRIEKIREEILAGRSEFKNQRITRTTMQGKNTNSIEEIIDNDKETIVKYR